MFQRHTDELKRAMYFAAQLAKHESAEVIDSTFLLRGLLTDTDSRANVIFHLCQLLPEDAAKQAMLKSQQVNNKCDLIVKPVPHRSGSQKKDDAPNEISLGGDGQRILVETAREANRLRDYWIDTEHLVLGMLREGGNAAAAKLRAAGLDLEISRQRVSEGASPRTPRPNPVIFWVQRRPIGFALGFIFALGVITALTLLGIGRWGIAITIAILAIGPLLRSLASTKPR
jgi:ATP-dependent Clp protease ATP-binding subunit ClpA